MARRLDGERFAELWGEPAAWGRAAGAHPHEAPVLRLDSAKAREQLGWTPVWDLEAGHRRNGLLAPAVRGRRGPARRARSDQIEAVRGRRR